MLPTILLLAIASPVAGGASWTLQSEPTKCAIQQQDNAIPTRIIGLAQYVGAHDAEAILVAAASSGSKQGQGTLTLVGEAGALSLRKSVEWFPAGKTELRAMRFNLAPGEIKPLLSNGPVTATIDGQPSVVFAPTNVEAGLAMLRSCQGRLLAAVGIDSATEAKVATPAVADASNSTSLVDDYPPESVRRGEQGSAIVLWTISKKGAVKDCRVMASSGSAALDNASCHVVTKRFHYSPALDADRQPIESHDSMRVNWTLTG